MLSSPLGSLQRLFLAAVFTFSFWVSLSAPAATHYLMIQGDFSGGGMETYYWKLEYDPSLVQASYNGQWAMNKIFGDPVRVGTTSSYVSERVPGTGVRYTEFVGFGLFVDRFFVNDRSPATGNNLSWSSWYALGGYQGYDENDDEAFIPYGAGGGWYDEYGGQPNEWLPFEADEWISGNVGLGDRWLFDPSGTAGVSYDAWIYGEWGTPPTSLLASMATMENLNWGAIFSGVGFTVYASVVPEPGRVMLFMLAGMGMLLGRCRRR